MFSSMMKVAGWLVQLSKNSFARWLMKRLAYCNDYYVYGLEKVLIVESKVVVV